jgi:hypothetical protein
LFIYCYTFSSRWWQCTEEQNLFLKSIKTIHKKYVI